MQSYTHNLKTASYDLSVHGRLTIPGLLRHMQQAAHEHAMICGVGFHHLKQRDIYWVLSSFLIEIDDLPLFDEPYCIETWPCEIDRLFTSRDFLVFNESNVFARASTKWLMVNAVKKRPVRPEQELAKLLFNNNKRALASEIPSLQALDKTSRPHEIREVRYCDLDVNRHVNNTRYIEWVLDAIHHEGLDKRPIKAISVNFISEFVDFSCAQIYYNVEGDGAIINIEIAHENGKTGVLCRISLGSLAL